MRHLIWLCCCLPLGLLAGCVHVREGSSNAGKDQIEAHLRSQLHCAALELRYDGPDRFIGAGKNETGDFTIKVRRKDGKFVFEGAYTGGAHGSFSGSAAWNKSLDSTFGFHQFSDTSESSLNSH